MWSFPHNFEVAHIGRLAQMHKEGDLSRPLVLNQSPYRIRKPTAIAGETSFRYALGTLRTTPEL